VAIFLPYAAIAAGLIWLRLRTKRERLAEEEWAVFISSRDALRMNILRSLEDRIVVYDKEMRMTGKYGRLEKRDFSSSQVRGISLADALSTLPEDQSGLHIDAVRRALGGEVVQYEWAWQHEGQERGRYHTKVCPVRTEEGEVVGAVSVSRDITALKGAEGS
jgi:PAS domain-containing protein